MESIWQAAIGFAGIGAVGIRVACTAVIHPTQAGNIRHTRPAWTVVSKAEFSIIRAAGAGMAAHTIGAVGSRRDLKVEASVVA